MSNFRYKLISLQSVGLTSQNVAQAGLVPAYTGGNLQGIIQTGYIFKNYRISGPVSGTFSTATGYYVGKGLYSSYTGSAKIYKMNSPSVELRNFSVVGKTYDANTILVGAYLLVDPVFEDLHLTLSDSSCLTVDRCFEPVFRNIISVNNGIPSLTPGMTGSTDYGLALSNCQHARVFGGYLYGRRHGIGQGDSGKIGSVPTRDTQVIGSLIENCIDDSGTIIAGVGAGNPAADFHGNVAFSAYRDSTISGGLTWSGQNNGYYNCTVSGGFDKGILLQTSNVLGGTFIIDGCRFSSSTGAFGNPSSVNRGFIDIQGLNANTKLSTTFIVKNSQFDLPNSTGEQLIWYRNNGVTGITVNFEVDNITAYNMSGLGAILRTGIITGTGNSGDYMIINNINRFPQGTILHYPENYVYTGRQRLQKQSGQMSIQCVSGNIGATGAVNFHYSYGNSNTGPYPMATVSLGSSGIVGNTIAIPSVNSLNQSTLVTLLSPASLPVAFSASGPVTVNWLVYVDNI